MRVSGRGHQSDETAKRQPDHIAAFEVVEVKDFEELFHEVVRLARAGGIATATVTQQVVSQNPAFLGEHFNYWVPHGVVETDSVNQYQWGAFSVDTAERRGHEGLSNPISSISEYRLPIR